MLTPPATRCASCDDPARLEAELAAFRPDLVLMDVLLPGVSGYDLVRSLRQDERYATLPVIVLTTQGELDARIEAARAGGDEHLVKPVSPGAAPLDGGRPRRARRASCASWSSATASPACSPTPRSWSAPAW